MLLFLCIFYLPYTPRWLAGEGRFVEAAESLAWIRNRPIDDELIKIEMLEIRAEAAFEAEINAERYPHLVDGSRSAWKVKAQLQLLTFGRLFTTKHMFKRTATAGLSESSRRCPLDASLTLFRRAVQCSSATRPSHLSYTNSTPAQSSSK